MALSAKSLLGPVGRLAMNPSNPSALLGPVGHLLNDSSQQVGNNAVGFPQQGGVPQVAGQGTARSFPGMPAFQAQGPNQPDDRPWLTKALQGAKEVALGTPGGSEQLQNFQPWQQYIQYILGNLGLENADFGGIAQEAKNRFQRETIPGIAERFQGMPGSNQNSSGLQSALGAAGANLEERLASLRSQYGLQQLAYGLQPQFENIYKPASEGAIQKLLPYAAKAGAAYAGFPIK